MTIDIKTIKDDLDFVSNRIGEQTRTISIGVLAIAWLFLAGGKDAPAVKVMPDVFVLLSAGALSIGSLLADYFQYLCAYFVSLQVLNNTESNLDQTPEPEYNYQSFFHKSRRFFFWLKQITCLFATGILIYAIVEALLESNPL